VEMMKWNKQDLTKYVQAKEYIDTAIIPLIPFSFQLTDEQLITQAFQKEVVQLLCDRVEVEYAGRVMLLPGYQYIPSIDIEKEINRLNEYVKEIHTLPFQHIFFLTFDPLWKKHEKSLEANLLWLPVMKDGDLQNKETQQIVMDHVHQITDLIRSFWM
jgi:hypothetical protein